VNQAVGRLARLGRLPTWLLALLLLPILALEVQGSARFQTVTPTALIRGDASRVGLVSNLVFWVCVFVCWVPLAGEAAMTSQVWLQWFGTEFWWPVGLVWKGGGSWTLYAGGLWLVTYHVVVVRRRRARVLVSLVMPIAMTFGLMALILQMGGPGGLVDDAEREAAGARLAFDVRTLTPRLDPNHPDAVRSMAVMTDGDFGVVREHGEVCTNPRSVCVSPDGSVAHVFFGCTWGLDKMFFPSVIRVDLKGGEVTALSGHNIRQVACPGAHETLAVAPWDGPGIYELSAKDLSLKRTILRQTDGALSFWEPLDVVLDRARQKVYVANNGETAVLIYDQTTGTLEHIVNLAGMGLVRTGGGGVHRMRLSPTTGLLYGVTGPGVNLFEIDPIAGTLLRTADFGDIVGTGFAADFEAGRLYYQSGFSSDLHEVDLATFEVLRTFEGEVHGRRLALDRRRRVLYVTGYFSGLVTALDLDSGERLWELPMGPRPQGVDLTDDALWVNTQDGLFELDLTTAWRHFGFTEARYFPEAPFVYDPVDP
jgi:DNA-binding beta-propeller fold protein YncE